MFTLPFSKYLKFAVAAASLAAHAAFATPTDFSGELSATDGFFDRPADFSNLTSFGNHVAYDTYAFQVSTAGNYAVEATAFTGIHGDTFLFLYQGAFDPSHPLQNLVAYNDDGPLDNVLSYLTADLQTDTQYYLVFTSYYNDSFGTYTGVFSSADGVGQVLLGDTASVPEPATLALFPLALLGMALAGGRKRR